MSSAAKFNVSNLARSLKLAMHTCVYVCKYYSLCIRLSQCAAYIGRGSTKQLSTALPFLMEASTLTLALMSLLLFTYCLHKQAHEACKGHATTTLIEAHLFLDDLPSAQSVRLPLHTTQCISPDLLIQVLDSVTDKDSNEQLVALQGKIHLAEKDYSKALTL